MSEIKRTNFNIAFSLNRVNNILDANPQEKMEKRKSIPAESAMTYENGFYVDCVALCVDIRGSSKLPQVHKKPVLAKIYRAYLSEISALMKSCTLKRHINIVGDAVLGIFDASKSSEHVKEVFEVGARISTLIDMLNDRFEKKGYQTINVGIGIAYGEVLMVKAGLSGSGISDTVWMGDVVNTASKIGNEGHKPGNGQYMVCETVFNSLPASHRQYLTWNDTEGCYHGTIQHVETKEAYEKIKKSRATIPPRTALNPYAPSPTLATPLSDLSRRQTMSTLLGGLGSDSLSNSSLTNLAKALYGDNK